MIKLELNLKGQNRKIELQDEILFNALLCQNKDTIKKMIKISHPLYNISPVFFDIVNRHVDITEDGKSLYGGLIVRTSFDEFAVLYLVDAQVDDDYVVELVKEYLENANEHVSMDVNINKIEIDKSLFLRSIK